LKDALSDLIGEPDPVAESVARAGVNSEEPWVRDIVLCDDLTQDGAMQKRVFREPMHVDVDRQADRVAMRILLAASHALWLATVRVRVA